MLGASVRLELVFSVETFFAVFGWTLVLFILGVSSLVILAIADTFESLKTIGMAAYIRSFASMSSSMHLQVTSLPKNFCARSIVKGVDPCANVNWW